MLARLEYVKKEKNTKIILARVLKYKKYLSQNIRTL